MTVPLPASAPARPVIDAIASSSERSISFYNLHTKEKLTVTYKRNGRFVPGAMDQINHMLRDWRRDESIKMDPKLIDLVYEIHNELGSREPIGIVSGYRSPATNSSLRRRSSGVAKNSQHILGKAMDVWFPDVPLQKLREMALLHESGGVGYYPTSGRPFVHIDVGPVRYWPRMPRTELARLFPDGDTKYIPADGKPLPRKVRTQDIQVARLEEPARKPTAPLPPSPAPSAPLKTAVAPQRTEEEPKSSPAEAPLVVARADPSVPVIDTSDSADDGDGFSLGLFGFKETDDQDGGGKPQQAIVAGLDLPKGPSAPLPTVRPESEPAVADTEEPLTIASLLARESAESVDPEPLITASLPAPRPEDLYGNSNFEGQMAAVPLLASAPAESDIAKPMAAAPQPEPAPAPTESRKTPPLALAWSSNPEPAVGDRQPQFVASLWAVEPEPKPAKIAKTEPPAAEPAYIGRKPQTVASLWAAVGPMTEALARKKPLAAAPQPEPAPEKRLIAASMALPTLGPGRTAPPVHRSGSMRGEPGIWNGGTSYEPPRIDQLVSEWRVSGEAFAAFTAPDQAHLAGLMRAPAQSLSMTFARGPAPTVYAGAFVGPAISPLMVVDLSAPLVTASR